jgi:hypothetical protein
VIDFDVVVRDPDHPSRLLPRFASDDRHHPNDAGYQTMADAIDLSFFSSVASTVIITFAGGPAGEG